MVDATDLKSVLAKSGVWVRIPSSALSRPRILLGNSLGFAIFVDSEGSRTKTHENTIYSSSIRQVITVFRAGGAVSLTAAGGSVFPLFHRTETLLSSALQRE